MPQTTPPKVLIITGSLPPIRCGIGHYTKRLLIALSQELRPEPDFTVLSTDGVEPILDLPLRTVLDWRFRRLPAMLRIVRQAKPDVVHIEYPAVGYGRQVGINLLPLLLRLFGFKTVVTLHEYHQSSKLGKIRNLMTILPANQVVVSNFADYSALKRRVKNIELIPIGSNLIVDEKSPITPEKALKNFGLDPKKPTLYFFGFPFPNKGVEHLIDALELLPNYQLLLMSAYEKQNAYHQELKQKVAAINKNEVRVAWTGFLDDTTVAKSLKPGAYFVLPQQEPLSAKSSTPLTAAEAGQIVIAKIDHHGNQAPYSSRHNCYLVDTMNAESIATAVQLLDSKPQLRTEITKNTAHFKDYFSWKNIAKAHNDIYQRFAR